MDASNADREKQNCHSERRAANPVAVSENCRKGALDPLDSAKGKTFARDDNAEIGGSLAAMEKRSTIWRRMITGGSPPRFQGENFQRNLDLVERAGEIAREKKCTPAQPALA